MENIRVTVRRASFTVEAVFVMSITIWIIMAICYLALYSHDNAVMYSLAEHYVEQAVEDGKEWKESELQSGLKKYLQKHVMISQIDRVSVNRQVLSVKAEIAYHVNVEMPFIKTVLSGGHGATVCVFSKVLFPPYYMWDAEEIKDAVK